MECQQGSPIHFSPIGNHAAVQPTAQVLGDEIHQEDEKWVWPRSIMLHRSQQPLNNHKHSFQHSCEEDPSCKSLFIFREVHTYGFLIRYSQYVYSSTLSRYNLPCRSHLAKVNRWPNFHATGKRVLQTLYLQLQSDCIISLWSRIWELGSSEV